MEKEVDGTLVGLNAEELFKALHGKELNTKKSVLEYIEILRKNRNDITEDQMQQSYNLVYKNINLMAELVKSNTIMYLKNQLKTNLGKYVKETEVKEKDEFINFFKSAYPKRARRKDYTLTIMNPSGISDEQIWQTLTYINRWIFIDKNEVNKSERDAIVKKIEKLVNGKQTKYVNQVKSMDRLLKKLGIKLSPREVGYVIEKI